MSSDSDLILEVWETFRDMLPAGKREDAAIRMLKVFENHDIEIDVSLLEGNDQYLDEALALNNEDDESYDEDDDDDNDGY